MPLTTAEIGHLQAQRLGWLATLQPDGLRARGHAARNTAPCRERWRSHASFADLCAGVCLGP